jgi:hypothetical protein
MRLALGVVAFFILLCYQLQLLLDTPIELTARSGHRRFNNNFLSFIESGPTVSRKSASQLSPLLAQNSRMNICASKATK